MPWFHIQRGIYLMLIGGFVFVFDHVQPLNSLFPAFAGAFIVVASLAAIKFRRWFHMLMQCVTLMTFCLLIWCGAKLSKQPSSTLMLMQDLGVMWIAIKSAFITSTAFQDEFEDESEAGPIDSIAKGPVPNQENSRAASFKHK